MQHLGIYADLADAARRQARLRPSVRPGQALQREIRDVLGFAAADGVPDDVRLEQSWEDEGLCGEEVSWSLGYGPRTRAWVLRPLDATGPLPGVVALHCHSGVKTYGKEKIARGPSPVSAAVRPLHDLYYGGRPYANALAQQGFVVIVPDVFLWSSRRFPLETMPERLQAWGALTAEADGVPDQAYERAARLHEDLVSKYTNVLGTSLAGIVAHEDRAAVAYLRSRTDVADGPVGCVGLSGGGCRSALLQATCDSIGAAVVVGMMSTHDALLDRHIETHTWMFLPPGLARLCDWPDLAAARAPSPLLVQYDREDALFPPDGMIAADKMIAGHYEAASRRDAYVGEFYDGPHKFDLRMQQAAFGWLDKQLRHGSG